MSIRTGLSVRTKIAAAFLALFLTLVGLGALFSKGLADSLEFVAHERQGVILLGQLHGLLESIPEHRGACAASLRGATSLLERCRKARHAIDQALQQPDPQLSANLKVKTGLQELLSRLS